MGHPADGAAGWDAHGSGGGAGGGGAAGSGGGTARGGAGGRELAVGLLFGQCPRLYVVRTAVSFNDPALREAQEASGRRRLDLVCDSGGAVAVHHSGGALRAGSARAVGPGGARRGLAGGRPRDAGGGRAHAGPLRAGVDSKRFRRGDYARNAAACPRRCLPGDPAICAQALEPLGAGRARVALDGALRGGRGRLAERRTGLHLRGMARRGAVHLPGDAIYAGLAVAIPALVAARGLWPGPSGRPDALGRSRSSGAGLLAGPADPCLAIDPPVRGNGRFPRGCEGG